MLQATLYRYLGEKTVHMNRCVLNTVHASMTERTLLHTKVVSKIRCPIQLSLGFRLSCFESSSAVAEVHHKGPAQLPQKVKMPTATTLYPSIPLYALERSMEEMALDPPNAKNEAC